MKKSYLNLSGYRLPTESEMEYATRAGAKTSRYYGQTEELLSKYAWYQENSQEQTWPVGSLKPNDFGFFDMHGNVFSWCQDHYDDYPWPTDTDAQDDPEPDLIASPSVTRVLRGGAYSHPASEVRSAVRFNYVPTLTIYILGIRVARTVAP